MLKSQTKRRKTRAKLKKPQHKGLCEIPNAFVKQITSQGVSTCKGTQYLQHEASCRKRPVSDWLSGPGVSLLAPAWSRLCLEASWTERRTSGSFLEPVLAPGLRKWLFCPRPGCLGFHQRGSGGQGNVSLGSEGWILPAVRGLPAHGTPPARVSDLPASLPPSPSAAPPHPVTGVTVFTDGSPLTIVSLALAGNSVGEEAHLPAQRAIPGAGGECRAPR